MLMFLSICLYILAYFVVSFPVYVNDIQLLFLLSFWVSETEITFCFFLFYTVICLWFCCRNRCFVQVFVYILIHLYNYLLLWDGLCVCRLNCRICLVVGGDVWTTNLIRITQRPAQIIADDASLWVKGLNV